MTMLVMDPGETMTAIAFFAAAAFSIKAIAAGVIRYAEIQARGKSPEVPGATEERLARIEQAVDSIAIEVERISEGQRFTTKLLAERVTESDRVGR
jgi:hypothetical protein